MVRSSEANRLIWGLFWVVESVVRGKRVRRTSQRSGVKAIRKCRQLDVTSIY